MTAPRLITVKGELKSNESLEADYIFKAGIQGTSCEAILSSSTRAAFVETVEWTIIKYEYADALLVLSHGSASSVRVIKEALNEFSKTSGLIPNMSKSTIFFGNLNNVEKQQILDILPLRISMLPMKYLGVPLITKRLGINDCKGLVEKVKAKVNDWKNKYLYFARRSQLIAFVLASIQVYWASLFLIPKSTVREIDKVLKAFLWCQGESINGRAKVAWKTICTPKKEGDLGLKPSSCWNEE